MKKMAYTVGKFEFLPEIFVANIDGSDEKQLSMVHKTIHSEIVFSRADRLRYKSYDGTEIEGWLLFPYDYHPETNLYPMIVHSHGGPHSASGYGFNFKHQLFAASGYFVLQTNFRGSTGYGDEFKWAIWGQWGTLDGQDVMAGIDYVIEHSPVDKNRIGHTGHSYGGFMTNWLITQYPDRLAGAVAGASISNWLSDYGTADVAVTKETEFFGNPWTEESRNRLLKQSPLIYAGNVKTPTLFLHGELDNRVPYEEGEQMYFALKRNGVPAKMIKYADVYHGGWGHWNNVHRIIHELKWFNKYLKPVAGIGVQSSWTFSQPEEKHVIAAVEQFFKALETRNADLARSILMPEGVVFSVREENGEKNIRATTHEQIIKSLASSTEKMLERMWNPKVLIHKEIAVVWTKYDFHREGKFSHCGVDAFNLIKTSDGWRISGIFYTVEKEGCEENPLGPPKKKK
jgi:acetyl esterase/lipase